jgi:Lanthionine synthetase C-like protein
MSRVMAVAADPDGQARHEEGARSALADTAAAIDATVTSMDDLSLCHGLAGLAETLRLGVGVLGDEAFAAVGDTGIRACATVWRSQPHALDAAVRRDPSLMAGAAGVLHLLIRAAAPGLVAPVMLGPAEP